MTNKFGMLSGPEVDEQWSSAIILSNFSILKSQVKSMWQWADVKKKVVICKRI